LPFIVIFFPLVGLEKIAANVFDVFVVTGVVMLQYCIMILEEPLEISITLPLDVFVFSTIILFNVTYCALSNLKV
jgi:hypothetical protein